MTPNEAYVTTPCLGGCASRLGWTFEPGSYGGYWEPPEPDQLYPTVGCSEAHLERAAEDDLLVRQAWQLQVQYEAQLEGSFLLMCSSVAYLSGNLEGPADRPLTAEEQYDLEDRLAALELQEEMADRDTWY